MGTADVGLASAGWGARAQDASAILTNPAGMTRLDGAAEYAYGGTLDVDKQGAAPVALGGRGDLVGSYKDTGMLFLAVNFNWVF